MSGIDRKKPSKLLLLALPVLILVLAATPCSVHAFSEALDSHSGHAQSAPDATAENDCISQALKPGAHITKHIATLTMSAILVAPELTFPALTSEFRIIHFKLRKPLLLLILSTPERAPPLTARA
ncbi:MAG: hypothetical protein HOC91_11345 [Nitrospinaceae bacterium]|mgnify:FL=1|jgi:hypothetical protein|nr:hypothetical protein [Nitrospinaceae bacterium]MBT3433654.1 hypothetical protein [Nitrospinaceae bacterium]MBT3821150.1 hypothetical protein [Nitrospinaceae bacterium]MBT4093582.1 hypothetical protein [Nitrospinaceae bacterium]MBT4431101.1 hypothetical protein [Nitrospinaceae bacterium]